MPLEHLEALVEEASMEAALRALLPKMIGSLPYEIHRFQGKQALLRNLPQRLRTYRRTLTPGSLVLVVVDRDRDDCRELKALLERTADAARMLTRTRDPTGPFQVLNRIAIEELEAWYFGDWEAVTAAFPRIPADIPRRARYRNPDAIAGGTWEALQRIMNQFGYYQTGLPKLELAQRISPHMIPTRNTSHSFQMLHGTLLQISRASKAGLSAPETGRR